MKLAVKLTSTLVIGIVVVMALYAAVQISNEVVLSEADAHRARRNGLAWLGTIESVWAHEGEERARELIQLSARRAGAPEGVLRVVSLAEDAPDRPPLSVDEFRTLAAGDVVRRVLPDADGEAWQHVWAAIRTARTPTAIEMIEPLDEERTFVRMSHLAIVGATVAVIAICALLATLLETRLVGRPLTLLRDKARRAGAGDFSGPLLLRQRDEMGDLAAEINAMCDRLAEANRRAAAETAARIVALEQLRHSERLATVGQLAAGVAHELGTPLNVIATTAELVDAEPGGSDMLHTSCRVIIDQSERMATIIRQLLDFGRRGGSDRAPTELAALVQSTVVLLRPLARKRRVELSLALPKTPVRASVNPLEIGQV
ncbi:MAG TPA: histidine kinase dimerization/phospho-acceptor domain-containing protein, partial [Candidatus Binatia bacterium]|nr:histidine kinase dimerization/phospho-acceptor domain-containing protein [Candidatus Binatia bacterium]